MEENKTDNIYALTLDDDNNEIILNQNEYAILSFKDAIEIFDNEDYEYYSGVNSLTDLAYELIDQIGGIKDAVSDPENYIDEEALRRDLSFDIREMMRDNAEYEIDEK